MAEKACASIQGLAIYRWTELQWNVDFVKGHTVGYPWHFKSNEDIIFKFEWLISDPTFLPSWTWPFLAIFNNTETRDRTDYNPAFYNPEGFKV